MTSLDQHNPNGGPTHGVPSQGSAAAQQPASATAAYGAAPAQAVPRSAPTNKVTPAGTPASAKPGAADGRGRSPKTAKVPTPDTDPVMEETTPCPYFFPEGTMAGDVPLGVRCAIKEMATPIMEKMVIAEQDPLAKAIAGPLPFEKTAQILLQAEFSREMLSETPDPEEIERLMNLLDRSAKRVHHIEDKLVRIRRQPGLLR